ncbi:hypothetical protein ACSBR2_021256 [Camellia fascicularis]
MKPQNFSGDSSLIHESKRTIGEKFRQVYEKAMVSMIGNEIPMVSMIENEIPMRRRSDRDYKCRYERLISREIERRKGNWRYGVEDPIRTIMFLGSWSHT